MAIAELERKLQAQTPPPVHTTATPPRPKPLFRRSPPPPPVAPRPSRPPPLVAGKEECTPRRTTRAERPAGPSHSH